MDFNNDSGTLSNVSVISTTLGNVSIQGVGSLSLPSGSTEQRPALGNGQIRYNSTTGFVEALSNGAWVNIKDVIGLPAGGALNDVLIKQSTTDYDAAFGPITADMAPYAKQLIGYVRNDDTVTLPKGTPVYESGVVGNSWTIAVKAANASDVTKMPAIGVLAQDLAPAATGNIIVLGEIRDVNTSAFTAGDAVYVAEGGGYTNIKPTGMTIPIQFLGFVTKVHATNGGGFVTGTGGLEPTKYQNGEFYSWDGASWELQANELIDLLDVQWTGNITLGQHFVFNGTHWTNADDPPYPVTSVFGRTGDIVLTSSDINTALSYIPYDSANPSQYTTKSYVDSLATGQVWLDPVVAFNFVGNSSTPLAANTVVSGSSIALIEPGGNTGDWASFSPGELVGYVDGVWSTRGFASVGMRVGVNFVQTATTVGVAVGRTNQIGTITGGAPGSWTWSWYSPVNGNAVFNNNTTSVRFGQSYSYVGAETRWVQFGGPSIITAGEALAYTGNTLNVIHGAGIEIANNHLFVDNYPSGGIFTTIDGTTADNTQLAQLSLTHTGVTPGVYTQVTVDSYGRVTLATNPTSLAGYGITDAQPLNTDLTAITSISGTTGLLMKQGAGIWTLDTANYLTTNETITITGDATGSGANTIALTLANTAVTSGTYGSTTQVPVVTVNSKGLVTGVSNVTIASSAGTVTSVSVASANGLTGTVVTATSTPVITLSTTVTGMLKGNGTAITSAVPGTDYVVPTVGGGVGLKQISTVVTPITGTTNKADSNVAPVITDGTQIWTQSTTPASANSKFTLDGSFYIDHNTNNRRIVIAIWRTVLGVNTLVGVSSSFITASGNGGEISISFYDSPATTSPVAYSLRAFANGIGTWYVAQSSTAVFAGNLGKQIIRLTESS